MVDGGQPEGVDAEEAAAVRAAFKKPGLAGALVIRVITSSRLPEEMAVYARRMFDAYTAVGLPAELVHGLVLNAINTMAAEVGQALGGVSR